MLLDSGAMAVRRQRVRFLETENGLDVQVDARPDAVIIVFLCAWLAVWLVGEWTLIARMSAEQTPEPDPFAFVWLCFWSVGGALGALIAFVRLKRRELIRLSAAQLHYYRDYRWFLRSLQFERDEIRDLRAVPEAEYDPVRNIHASYWSWDTGGIEFLYRGAVYRIASRLDREESERLAERICTFGRLPGQGASTSAASSGIGCNGR